MVIENIRNFLWKGEVCRYVLRSRRTLNTRIKRQLRSNVREKLHFSTEIGIPAKILIEVNWVISV